MNATHYAKAIEEHYETCWAAPVASLRLTVGRIEELPRDFCVLAINRSPEVMVYATRCMSQPEDRNRIELHMMTANGRRDEMDIVEVLTAVAHYHRTGQWLDLGHSVNFGQPWIRGSSCTRGVISLPYLDGPDLEWLTEPSIRFLWMIPVTEAEVEFKKANGMEALEERFESAQFNYLDPMRGSVV